MTDPAELWDFDDPAASEHRFREAAVGSDRAVMLTQVARALGLQEAYDAGHALLDEVAVATPRGRGPGPAAARARPAAALSG